jgi:RNA polymerase sigma-I factor
MEQYSFAFSNRDKFIEDNKGYIYNIASQICKRKLDWKNDDELSIALIAFNSACDSYSDQKGNFLNYAKVLIKNALIDFFRKSKNNDQLIFSDEEEKIDYIDNRGALTEFHKEQENMSKAEEIALFSQELLKYKLTLEDIVDASPSHIDTRNTILNLAFKCSKEDTIINYVKNKKNLPIKEIILLTGVNRKLIERWRKYILVLILIISSNDYQYIRSYLNIKVGDKFE